LTRASQTSVEVVQPYAGQVDVRIALEEGAEVGVEAPVALALQRIAPADAEVGGGLAVVDAAAQDADIDCIIGAAVQLEVADLVGFGDGVERLPL
jgi:hypothetical protein